MKSSKRPIRETQTTGFYEGHRGRSPLKRKSHEAALGKMQTLESCEMQKV